MDSGQQYPPSYLAEDRSQSLLSVVVVFAVLEVLFMSLFSTSRLMNHTANGWDVYLMIPGFLFCFSHIIVAALMLQYGGAGRHVVALDPKVVILWLKLDVAEEFIYNFSLLFPKLAILCLYARVFSTRPYRYATYSIGLFVILTCVSGQIVGIAICRPFAYIWDKSIPDGYCGDIPAAYRYISIPNLISDICILVLPLYGVWHLHTRTINKIGLTFTFLLGCLGMITGIIRLVYFFQIDMFEDVTFHAVGTMTWTLVEPGVYLIAATLPSLRPLIRYLFKDIEFKALYKNLHNRYSRTFSKQKNSEGSMADKHYDTVARPLKAGTVGHVARSAGFVRIDERKTSGSNTSQQDIGLDAY